MTSQASFGRRIRVLRAARYRSWLWLSTSVALAPACSGGGGPPLRGSNTGGQAAAISGAAGRVGSGGATTGGTASCDDCQWGTYCATPGECIAFHCDVTKQQCKPSKCEGTGGCGISSDEIVPLATVSMTRGLCHDETGLFVLDQLPQGETRLRRLSWPALEPLVWYSIPNADLYGDAALLDGFIYYPDNARNAIGRFSLISGELTLFPAPATEPRAVAVDSDSLWVSTDGQVQQLFRLSLSGERLGRIPNSAVDTGCEGLEATPTGLWCLDRETTTLTKLSKEDGSVLAGPFFAPSRMGLALIDGELWAGSDGFSYSADGLSLIAPASRTSGIARLNLQGVAP